MRKKLLIGLALYLAVGVAFGFVTDAQDYMCRDRSSSVFFGKLESDGKFKDGDPGYYTDGTLVEAAWGCFPILDGRDRAQWVATATPAWLPLVARNVVRGVGVPIGSIRLGG